MRKGEKMEAKKPEIKEMTADPRLQYTPPDIRFYPYDPNEQILNSSGSSSDDGMEDEL